MLFRGGTDVKSDERSALVYRMLTMPTLGSRAFIYPTLLALHRLSGDEGTPVYVLRPLYSGVLNCHYPSPI